MNPRRPAAPTPARPPRAAFPRADRWAIPLAIAIGLLVPAIMLWRAVAEKVPFSFPVDDAWIHLQYARNLVEHGAFTFFPGDHSTAGSTAPLFTLLETLLWFVSRNGIFTGLALGIAAWVAFLFVFAGWAARRLGSPGWAAVAVTIVVLDGRFGLLAISGMETSLFLLGLALAFLAWSRDDARGAGLALGAMVWVRPEALILAGVFALDSAIARRVPRRTIAGVVAMAVVIAGYLTFNALTGGTAFPNTLAAKAAYYGRIPLDVFLRRDVFVTFANGWVVLLAAAILAAAIELARRARGPRVEGERSVLAECGWALALVLAYAVVLRYSHRFNRYLVPSLPALAIAGVAGLRAIAGWGRARRGRLAAGTGIAIAAVTIAAGLQLRALVPQFERYAGFSDYHLRRQVLTGRWLAEHTPKDAVVATHDVGAIGFYSGRRVVDMVGLITPEVVPHLNRPDYLEYLGELFRRRGVGYLAVLDTWQVVDNERPLFVADPNPEIMRVYPWRPGRTHLLEEGVVRSVDAAGDALQRGDLEAARREAARALASDSGSSTVWTLAGAIADRQGRYAESGAAYARAIALYPESPQAHTGAAVALARLGRLAEARAQLDTLRSLGASPAAIDLVNGVIESAERPKR